MPAFARKTTIKNQFGARRAPGGVILCNGCHCNMADLTTNSMGLVYVLYVDKNHLKDKRPHDFYCKDCLTHSFPKAIML